MQQGQRSLGSEDLHPLGAFHQWPSNFHYIRLYDPSRVLQYSFRGVARNLGSLEGGAGGLSLVLTNLQCMQVKVPHLPNTLPVQH